MYSLDANLLRQSSNIMRAAVRDGVAETLLDPFTFEEIPLEMFHWVLGKSSEKLNVQDPNHFDLLQHPKSKRAQISTFPAATHPNITQYWAVELARIAVPQGSIGFLWGLEQVMNDAAGNYYPSNREFWGSPQFVLPDVDNARWYLTLDYYDGQLPDPFNHSGATPIDGSILPGLSYPELFEIDALWYPAGGNQSLNLIIPGARVLRFFFLTPPTTTYQWQVRGRLSAFTQSTFSDEAAKNARLLY